MSDSIQEALERQQRERTPLGELVRDIRVAGLLLLLLGGNVAQPVLATFGIRPADETDVVAQQCTEAIPNIIMSLQTACNGQIEAAVMQCEMDHAQKSKPKPKRKPTHQ